MSQIIFPIMHLPPVIDIGKQTERGVTRIGFDMHEWLDDWPGMKFSVKPVRPGETESYNAATKQVGDILYWLVGAVDTEKAGSGMLEVLGVTEDERKLSAMCRTSIANTNTATTTEIPEPNRPWVDQVVLAGEGAKESAREAKASAEAAAKSAEEASQNVADVFIVKVDTDYKADRTAAEILAAIEAGKPCILVGNNGRGYTYSGQEKYGGENVPTFRAAPRYGSDKGIILDSMYVLEDGSAIGGSYIPAKTPNLYKLKVTGAVEADYDGSSEVVVEIPKAGLPETADPLKQLVTDADGKVGWEERLAYETVREVVNLEPTELTYDAEEGMHFLLTPWAADIAAGGMYTINYNGADFECVAVDYASIVPEAPGGVFLLGNAALIGGEGIEGANPDAPFLLMASTNALGATSGNIYAMFLAADGATSVTISVRGVEKSVKKIDPKYLGKKTITITVNDDGTVTSDTSLADVWDMTPAELQSSIVIVGEGKMLTGDDTYSTATKVYKTEIDVEGYSVRGFNVQYERNVTDQSDAPSPVTKYISWMFVNGVESLVRDSYVRPEMPLMNGMPTSTMYLRWSGDKWRAVTIDQLKADLGLTGDAATTDVYYTADGQVFNTVDAAVLHVQKGDA